MLELRIEGQLADLTPETRIRLQLTSPLFGDEISGDISYPFSLPVTENNAEILRFVHLPASSTDRRREYQATITAGPVFLEGTLQVRKFGRRGYQVNLIVPPGNVKKEIWSKKLRELDFGSVTYPTEEKRTWCWVTDISSLGLGGLSHIRLYEGTTELYEKGYEGQDLAGSTAEGILDDFISEFNGAAEEPVISGTKRRGFILLPIPIFVTKKSADTANGIYGFVAYQIDNQLIFQAPPLRSVTKIRFEFGSTGRAPLELTFTEPKMQTWVDWQESQVRNRLLDDERFCLPMIRNTGLYDSEENGQYTGYYNYYYAAFYRFNDQQLTVQYSLVPWIRLPWALDQIAAQVGYTIEDSPFVGQLASLVFGVNQTLDEQVPGLNLPFNQFKSTIKFADHFPDGTARDFLTYLGRVFGFRIVFDIPRRKIRFIRLDDIPAKRASQDWTNRLILEYEGETADVENRQLKFALDSGDELAKDTEEFYKPYPELAADVRKTDIETPFCPVKQSKKTEYIRGVGEQTWYTYAEMKQRGRSPLYGLSDTPVASPRIGFFNESVTWRHSDVTDDQPRGGIVTFTAPSILWESGDYALIWNGDNGLAAKFWKKWLALLDSTYPLKRRVIIDLVDLSTILYAWDEKIHLDGLDYLPGLVDVELGVDGIVGSTEITWYKA